MAFTATFTNPKYNYTAGASGLSTTVPVDYFDLQADFRAVSVCFMRIRTDVFSGADYDDETADSTNALQLNSTFVLARDGTTWFSGYVMEKPTVRSFIDGNFIEITCFGKEGILTKSLCPDSSGNRSWTLETSKELLTDLPLQATSNYGSFQGSTLWPDPADANGIKCYLKDASSNSDTLDHNIGTGTYAITAVSTGAGGWFEVAENVPAEFIADDKFTISGSTNNDGDLAWTVASATWTGSATRITVDETVGATADGNIIQPQIVLSSTAQGFSVRGWMRLESEFIYYDGYDDAASDGLHRLRNVKRGELGTTAAAHLTASADIFEKLPKQIAPGTINVENDPLGGTAWEPLRRDHEYDVNVHLNMFILAQAAVGTYQVTYYVYDEDQSINAGSTVITLDDVIEDLVTAPRLHGGAGFASGDCDFTTGIKLNRYDYEPSEKPEYAYDAIMELIHGLGLDSEVEFWYRHDTDKFKLKVVQNSANSFTVPHIERIDRDRSLEEIYSGVLVRYQDDQSLNRATATYSWHQQATDSGTSPTYYESATDSSGWRWDNTDNTHGASAGNSGMEYTVDGKVDTKLGMIFDHDPTDTVEFGHYWFGSGTTPPIINLGHIEVAVNSYRIIGGDQNHVNSQKTIILRFQGCDDYNSSTNSGTWEDIGFEIEIEPNIEGAWVKAETSSFSKADVNAVRVVWDYMAGELNEARQHIAVIHTLKITGNENKYAYVQLTDDLADLNDVTKLYAPASFEKLRGGILSSGAAGAPRVLFHPIGASSDGAALSLARTLLKTKLRQYEKHHGRYEGLFPGTPALNLTITLTEETGVTYTGVLRGYSVSQIAGGKIVCQGTVLDYDASLIE